MRKSISAAVIAAGAIGTGALIASGTATAETIAPIFPQKPSTTVPVHTGNILCAKNNSRELTVFWQNCPAGQFWVQIPAQDIYSAVPVQP